MNLLFDNKLSPITNKIGFIKGNVNEVVDFFCEWQNSFLRKRNSLIQPYKLQGNLKELLLNLLPLTSVERRRYLFVPTKNNWVAYFDNGNSGADVYSICSYISEQMKTISIEVVASPSVDSKTDGLFDLAFSIYGPEDGDFLNYIRSISLVNENGKWEFQEVGVVQNYEDQEQYKDKKITNRFNLITMNKYLGHNMIDAFDEKFYSVDNWGILGVKEGPKLEGSREFNL